MQIAGQCASGQKVGDMDCIISIEEWSSISDAKKTTWMEHNLPANKASLAQRKLVCGVATNDAQYRVSIELHGKKMICPSYSDWVCMITRAYSASAIRRNSSYIHSSVCSDWLLFSRFRSWWMKNHVDGWQLDKDILSDSKTYSPDTCIFVPQWINVFASSMRKTARNSLIGAGYSKRDGVFAARCMNPLTGVNEYLGTFTNEHGAHESWRSRKMSIANELKSDFDKIDERIYPSIIKMIDEAK